MKGMNMNTFEQILKDIGNYQPCKESKEIDNAMLLRLKIDILSLIDGIYLSQVVYMDAASKNFQFSQEQTEIERMQNICGEAYKKEPPAKEQHNRVCLDNVWNCEEYVLSIYNGDDREFIKDVLLRIKVYFTQKYGALMDLPNSIRLYSHNPNSLHDAIMESIDNEIDSQGRPIFGWKVLGKTGMGNGIIVCTEDDSDQTLSLLFNIIPTRNEIKITSSYLKDCPENYEKNNKAKVELLLRFGKLWRSQLANLV